MSSQSVMNVGMGERIAQMRKHQIVSLENVNPVEEMEMEKNANILKPQIRVEDTGAKGTITSAKLTLTLTLTLTNGTMTTQSVCLCKSYASMMRSVTRQKRMYPRMFTFATTQQKSVVSCVFKLFP